jgi:diaminohydroxyphosphoribosylaminopyrimidine deaminase/5-amino-6-(5-phosphoribosylamino)uracil reductase
LRAAGLSVETGLCEAEAAELNAGFIQRVRTGRPLVTLKLAASLDGRIATASGESRWITGEMARERVHLLRTEHDAVLVGIGTALADDPQLTCRLPGMPPRSPVRVVIDRQLRLPHAARLIAETRQVPTWVVTSQTADATRQKGLRDLGVEVLTAETDIAGLIDPASALGLLGERGLTRLLVEGGGRLAAALLRAGLVDRLVWMNAPMLIGADGLPAVADLGLAGLTDEPRFEHVATEILGGDVLSRFRARRD